MKKILILILKLKYYSKSILELKNKITMEKSDELNEIIPGGSYLLSARNVWVDNG